MFRIDTPGSLPGGLWDEGNPFNALDGTIASAAFYNAVQEELAGFIENQGVVLDKADAAQLEEALDLWIGSRLYFDAPAGGVTAGDTHLIGDSVGVIQVTAAVGLPTNMLIFGEFVLPKNTSEAMGIGDRLWWDDATSEWRNASVTGARLAGTCRIAAIAAATTVALRLLGRSSPGGA